MATTPVSQPAPAPKRAPGAKPGPAMLPSGEPVAEVCDRATGARRGELDALVALGRELTGAEPVVWADRIVGFGERQYRTPAGRTGVMPLLAFAPGPRQHTVYLASNFAERWPELVGRLGPHRASVACLYFSRLSALDQGVLRELLRRSLHAK